jgi:hypothetical protein
VTTETDFGVSTPFTAAGGVTTGALAPGAPPPPHPDIEPNATALNSAHATIFFMLDLPAELMESARVAFHVCWRTTGYRRIDGYLKVIAVAERGSGRGCPRRNLAGA